MIRIDEKNQTVYLTLSNHMEVGVSLANYKRYGIGKIGQAIKHNWVKILYRDTWGYAIEHWSKEWPCDCAGIS